MLELKGVRYLTRMEAAVMCDWAYSTLYRKTRQYPDFPRPVRLANGRQYYVQAELAAWLTERSEREAL